MSKRKKIKRLQAQVVELETRLQETSAPTLPENKEVPKKKNAKTAVNVYFDSAFVNSLAGGREIRNERSSRRENDRAREESLMMDEEYNTREDTLREKDEVRTFDRQQREKARARRLKRRKKAIRRQKWGTFFGVFFKIIWYLIVLAVVVGFLSLIAMAVTWALVNFNLVAPADNQIVNSLWQAVNWLFGLFGMAVPTI